MDSTALADMNVECNVVHVDSGIAELDVRAMEDIAVYSTTGLDQWL